MVVVVVVLCLWMRGGGIPNISCGFNSELENVCDGVEYIVKGWKGLDGGDVDDDGGGDDYGGRNTERILLNRTALSTNEGCCCWHLEL
jgi:hypothetical protein